MKSYMNLKKIGLSFFCTLAAIGIKAQSTNTAYFTSGFDHRHLMNPAFMPERRTIDIPVLSNFKIGFKGNYGLDNFIYK